MSEMSPVWPVGEPWQLPMPDGTLYDALARAAVHRPHHPATAFYGALLSYAELRRRVDAMAGFLQSVCGVKRGDRVLIALQNSPQYVIAYYATMRADAVIVPVNPMNKTAEISYLAADSGATLAIVGSELCDVFAPLLGNLVLRRTLAIDVAIWCALGHSCVAQRTTLIRAIVLLRTKAAFCLVYRGGGGCEYRARRCHRSLLGLSRIRKAQRRLVAPHAPFVGPASGRSRGSNDWMIFHSSSVRSVS
jgi:AMP-binding enzyme